MNGLLLKKLPVHDPDTLVRLRWSGRNQMATSSSDYGFRFEIARDGIVLVEREPHCWAAFRAHAMVDWWDWAPTARMMHGVMLERLRREAGRGSS